MSTFVKLIPMELADIHDYQEPARDLAPEDQIVGEMSTDLKKLFTLSLAYARKTAEAKVELAFGKPSEDLHSVGRVSELEEKTKVITSVFWIAVKDELGLWDKESIGIRKGFRVVWNENSQPDLGDFLRNLFGGM